MVFLGGPRQVGKTTLAKKILNDLRSSSNYFNWDFDEDRKRILQKKWDLKPAIVLDEIHKYPKWKNFLKGVFDVQKEEHQFLITGSARLDLYKKGGDSLLGRYHYWRLHPLTLNELPKKMKPIDGFQRLMKVGGFPEPFLNANETEARRWRKDRFQRILREDIRDLERIQEIQNLTILVDQLKSRVGSLIVLSNLARDLQVAPNTIKRWIEALERMYLVFTVRPYTERLSRSISKPFKVYFFDNADVEGDEGARFENLVAGHLLKQNHFLEDSQGFTMGLHFIRDKEGREIDFVVTKDKKIESLIEVKWKEDTVSKHLQYYSERLSPQKSLQLVANFPKQYHQNQIKVLDAVEYLASL